MKKIFTFALVVALISITLGVGFSTVEAAQKI